jgi:hypothetical protein
MKIVDTLNSSLVEHPPKIISKKSQKSFHARSMTLVQQAIQEQKEDSVKALGSIAR